MAREVTALDGRRWRVRRRWLTRDLPRWRGVEAPDVGVPDLPVDDAGPLAAIGAVLLGVLLLVVLVLFVFPLVVFAVELVLVVALAALALAGRVVLRRPWVVEARSGQQRRRWEVRGWRAAGEMVDEVARELELGRLPPAGG